MKVKVKAIAVGTRVGKDGTIIHANPKGSDERARFPIVNEEDLPILLEDPALIRDPGDDLDPADAEDPVLDLTRADPRAAAKVREIADLDDEASPAPSGLGHREAVHYDPAQGVGAAASGIAQGDPDAPPADDEGQGSGGADNSVDQPVTTTGSKTPASEQDGSIGKNEPGAKGKGAASRVGKGSAKS